MEEIRKRIREMPWRCRQLVQLQESELEANFGNRGNW